MSAPYRNEGVGQGGFIGTFSLAGVVTVESWQKAAPSAHLILQNDQFGGPNKSAGIAGWQTISALVQLPFDGANTTEIQKGETVDAPTATHGGGTWYVTDVGETFQVGDYFKANLTLLEVRHPAI